MQRGGCQQPGVFSSFSPSDRQLCHSLSNIFWNSLAGRALTMEKLKLHEDQCTELFVCPWILWQLNQVWTRGCMTVQWALHYPAPANGASAVCCGRAEVPGLQNPVVNRSNNWSPIADHVVEPDTMSWGWNVAHDALLDRLSSYTSCWLEVTHPGCMFSFTLPGPTLCPFELTSLLIQMGRVSLNMQACLSDNKWLTQQKYSASIFLFLTGVK